ncbi:MAG: indolepyruvate ferredoxin oxidoreductase subunit alpha [Candidatus Micrarchaeia archaeon]
MNPWNINTSKCIYCAGCVSVCPVLCLTFDENRIKCDQEVCTKCKICEKVCPASAITVGE